jgi:glutathione S-transferase
LVALEELGPDYKHTPLNPRADPAQRAALNALNPNSHIPVLDDGGLIVWESMAINLYLADRYGGPLWPAQTADRALTYQWSLWAQTEIDRADWNRARLSGDEIQIQDDRQALVRALAVLDTALAGRDYLLGDAFSIVDVNVAVTLSEPHELGLIGWQRVNADTVGLPRLGAWLHRCMGRASYDVVRDLP